MKQYKVFVIANLIFGILLIALTKVILPVCRPMSGGVMRCGTSTTIVAIFVTCCRRSCGRAPQEKNPHHFICGNSCNWHFYFVGANSNCGNLSACPHGVPYDNCPSTRHYGRCDSIICCY